MKLALTRLARPFSVLACLLLAACDGSPSASDIQSAYEAQIEGIKAAAAQAGGNSQMVKDAAGAFLPRVKSVKKVSCTADGKDAYRCDVEVTATVGSGPEQTSAANLRIVKGSNGWMLTR